MAWAPGGGPRCPRDRSNALLDVSLTLDAPSKLTLLVEVEDDVPPVIRLRFSSRATAFGEVDPHVPLLPLATRTILARSLGALGLGVSLRGRDRRSLVGHLS